MSSTEIGESLVGAYLRYIEGCSLVLYNCFLGGKQGEVDVVAIMPPTQGTRRTVLLCEVTTHIRGMSAETVKKVPAKLERLHEYAQETFPGDEHHFQWWSPYVPQGKATDGFAKLEVAWKKRKCSLEFVINDDYTERIAELIQYASKNPSATSEPAYRMLQMLTRLRGPNKPTL